MEAPLAWDLVRVGEDEAIAVALANRVAIADGLELGDAESMPTALLKAARLASLGLDHLARARAMGPTETIRRQPPASAPTANARMAR